MRRSVLTLLVLLAALGWGHRCMALDSQISASLQKLLGEANENRTKLDKALVEELRSMNDTEINSSKTYLIETSILNHESKVSSIKEKLEQNHLLIEFLNAFISALEPARDARLDAPGILQEMAHRQILDSVESGQENKLWHYEVSLGIAIKNFMEPSEKFADFVRLFLENYPKLDSPAELSDFFKRRKYINSKEGDVSPSNPAED